MSQVAPAVAPPAPDVIFTGYTGTVGFLETLTVLGITGAAALIGIRAGTREANKYLRAAGWVGGIGSLLFGLMYLGSKSEIWKGSGIPALRVSPH